MMCLGSISIDILGNDLSIAQISHLLGVILHVETWMKQKLHPADLIHFRSYTCQGYTPHPHLKYLPAPSVPQGCYEPPPSTTGGVTSHHFQTASCHHFIVAYSATFLVLTSPTKYQDLSRQHILCTAVFMRILAINIYRIVPPFLQGSFHFLCVTDEVWALCTTSPVVLLHNFAQCSDF